MFQGLDGWAKCPLQMSELPKAEFTVCAQSWFGVGAASSSTWFGSPRPRISATFSSRVVRVLPEAVAEAPEKQPAAAGMPGGMGGMDMM